MDQPHHMLVFGVPEEPIPVVFKEIIDLKKCLLIVYHDPKSTPEIPSEYETPHYHGLVRATGKDFAFEKAWIRVREFFKAKGIWFKAAKVFSLPAVCAYLKMPGKEIVLNMLKGSTLSAFDNVSEDDIDRQVEKKSAKFSDKSEKVDVVNKLREFILDTGLFNETELLSRLHTDETFERMFKSFKYDVAFKKAQMLAAMRFVDMPLKSLFQMVRKQEWPADLYYTPDASVGLVARIMSENNIPMMKFVRDVANLMDRKKKKVNCLWLHGYTNAGKSYLARSLERLAMLYHSVPSGSNRFMWQDCVNKRLIIMNEPFFDESAIESVKQVLEGTGCYVPVKNKADQYLRATPVIITSNTMLWQFNSQAKQPLLSRCFPGYMNMASCGFLASAKKELHPLWLERALDCLERHVKSDRKSGKDENKDPEGEEEEQWDEEDEEAGGGTQTEEEVQTQKEDAFEKELETSMEMQLNKDD